MKVESEKVGLTLNIQKMKIMASSPTTSWEIDGETVETASDFIFWDSILILRIFSVQLSLHFATKLIWQMANIFILVLKRI